MSANFESGVTYGARAWHGQDNNLPADSADRWSVAATIGNAGLSWQVEKLPAMVSTEPGVCPTIAGAGVPDCYHVFRRQGGEYRDYLGTVGERYECLQNADIFAWFQPFLDSRSCSFESAGSLFGGRVVWAQALLDDGGSDIDLGGGEIIRKYLLLSSSHDGSQATRVGFSPQRVVCSNTLAMAHHSKASQTNNLLRVKHTSGQSDALSAVRDAVDMANQQFSATAAEYRRLMTCGISSADLRRYVKLVLDAPADDTALSSRAANQVDRIVALATQGIGQQGDITAWSAYQGVTQWLSHERQSDVGKRVNSLWFGDSSKRNQRALDLAIQLAS